MYRAAIWDYFFFNTEVCLCPSMIFVNFLEHLQSAVVAYGKCFIPYLKKQKYVNLEKNKKHLIQKCALLGQKKVLSIELTEIRDLFFCLMLSRFEIIFKLRFLIDLYLINKLQSACSYLPQVEATVYGWFNQWAHFHFFSSVCRSRYLSSSSDSLSLSSCA